MATHIWRRVFGPGDVRYKETRDLVSPGSGWTLASAPAVGKVSGAGESPARRSGVR